MSEQYERDCAIKEGERNAAEDGYFGSRPNAASLVTTKIFRDGFDRGWDRRASQPALATGQVLIAVDVPEDFSSDYLTVTHASRGVEHEMNFRIVQPALAQGDVITAAERVLGWFELRGRSENECFRDDLQALREALSAQREQQPQTASWDVKGDGVAYTTSEKILNSEAGRKLVEQAGQVKLEPHVVAGSEMERTTQSVVVPREMSDDEIMSFVEPGMVNPHGSLYSHRIVEFARALLGQREG